MLITENGNLTICQYTCYFSRMTKKSLVIPLLPISVFSAGQQYDGLMIEKRGVDQNNAIYTFGKEFVFNIHIQDSSSTFVINGDHELTRNVDSLKVSEIHMTVIKPKMFGRTNKNQTEVCYSYEPSPTLVASTGIVENHENVWIHPPRRGFFKSLETCPFPYVKLRKSVGYEWADSMRIGDHWSDQRWGEWEGKLLLNYQYKISGTETLHSSLGDIDCLIIDATASSKIGESRLKAYFSEVYGFVRLEYTLFTGIKIELDLSSVLQGPVHKDGKSVLEHKYK